MGRHELRYYQASLWTMNVSDAGVQAADSLSAVDQNGVATKAKSGREERKEAKRMQASATSDAATQAEQEAVTALPVVDIASEVDDIGAGEFGDGRGAPLYEFRASRFKGGRMFTPNVIRVWPDRIEEYEHHAVRRKGTQSIDFGQVAQVAVSRGLRWTDLSVESTGGHKILMRGMPKSDAARVKVMIDGADATARRGGTRSVYVQAAAPASPVVDVADQLRKLAELRSEGILSDAEFDAQKAKLLGS
ncbi:MAG: hypothetical protein QOG69_1852 [Actinomycetota bacterium]|nr:hypothetical protein [Actinomycetota bacterium]